MTSSKELKKLRKQMARYAKRHNIGRYNDIPEEEKEEVIESLIISDSTTKDLAFRDMYITWFNNVYIMWMNHKDEFIKSLKDNDSVRYRIFTDVYENKTDFSEYEGDESTTSFILGLIVLRAIENNGLIITDDVYTNASQIKILAITKSQRNYISNIISEL